jgi:DNA-binding protein HU-alpha
LDAEAEALAVEASGEDAMADAGEADVPAGPVLKKKELVERVAETAGVKKKTAKSVVEATLVELGAALTRGEALNLPPFGKVRVNRQRDAGGGEVLILRLRRAGKGGDEALAEAAD